MTTRPGKARVVLVGAGHGHLVTLLDWCESPPDLDVTVVDPGRFSYSGMATGVIAGDYAPDQASLDPESLIRRAGARLLRDRVVGIDRASASVALASGGQLPFDLLSLNIGSEPALAAPQGLANVFAVKPVSRLHALASGLAGDLSADPLLVVGGGVSAIEIACCAAARLGARGRVELAFPSEELGGSLPSRARRQLIAILAKRQVTSRPGCRVVGIDEGSVDTDRGGSLAWSTLVLAAGLAPPALLRGLDLEVSRHGLVVSHALNAAADPRVFAVGDCADIGRLGLPAIGVHGVRAGRILARNLAAAATGDRLTPYEPQQRYLSILNLGGKDGLALRGSMSWRGRAAWRLKDWIDRRFLSELSFPAHLS